MDGSNGGNASNGGGANPNDPQQQQQQQQQQRMHPGDSSRAVRAELEAKRRATQEKSRKYLPAVQEQIGRVFGDTTPAWYARLRLFTRKNYADLAMVSVLGLAVPQDRMLSDAEARAVTEHVARGADRMALINWGLTGTALLLTWRGRRTMRFPLYTPTVVLPPSNAYLRRAMWHGARYVAYSIAVSVTVQAPSLAYNVMYERSRMAADTRLRDLVDEQGHLGDKKPGSDWYSEGSPYRGPREGESIQEAVQSGWDTYKQSQQDQQQDQQQERQQQQPSEQYGQSTQSTATTGWGAQPSKPGWDSDDFDDASPVAASSQSNSNPYSGGGSSWDRLRQQSQAAPAQQQSQQQSWGRQQAQQRPAEQPQQSNAAAGGWGDSGDGVDRVAQEKAQREFDQMLERERQGDGQGRSGWGGR